MLEVKDKNLSAVKCINCIDSNREIKDLEVEWSKYKYIILEHSHLHYNKIRELLKEKNEYPAIEFYRLVEEALESEETIGNVVNAALHVWGYFKSIATEPEKVKFMKNVEKYQQGKTSKKTLKNILWRMTLKYDESYLLDSYYFYF